MRVMLAFVVLVVCAVACSTPARHDRCSPPFVRDHPREAESVNMSEFFNDDGSDEQYDAILDRVRTTPPSCLAGLTCTPEHAEEWDDHARWSIACRCGGVHGAVLGYPLDEISGDASLKGLFVGPLAFRCSACDTVTEMFDSAIHGYNAEISKGTALANTGGYRGEGPRVAASCPECGTSKYAVFGNFSHSHFDHIEDDPDLLDDAQDYFDGFACQATCAGCGHSWWVASFELA